MFDQNPVFIPGPTNLPASIRSAVDIPTRDHRSADFHGFFSALREDLKQVFKTSSGQVLLFPSSGTGGWEAAITNTLSAGDKVLVGSYGHFSNRWIALCRDHGLDVTCIECDWGAAAPIERFRDILASDKIEQYKAVLLTHNETATGVRSDVAAMRKALNDLQHPAMLFVDCVSSLASIDFRMDEWGVDIAVCGSQKGFMLPAGMAIVGVSPKAMHATEHATLRRSYFDFKAMVQASENGSYPYTPVMSLLNGLRTSVDLLLNEGLHNVFARHYRVAEGVRRAVTAWNLGMVAETPDSYSDTVTAIYVPIGFDADLLVDQTYRRFGMSFGGGLGELAGRVFRIGHLGQISEPMILSGIATIEMSMKDLGYPIELGAGVAAAQNFYRHELAMLSEKAA